MRHFFTLLILFVSLWANAQITSGHLDSGFVKINADKRLALVVGKPVQRGFVGKVKGYRVQIYNGNDRKKANQIKLEFMKAYPAVRSYLVYNNPQFRIRVGDFKARGEASQLQRKLSGTFNPCMIVPDIINYSTAPIAKPKKTASTIPTTAINDKYH
jgi:hypothetical protein